MISYYIEDIAEFHPELEVEHIILASVSIMARYSDNHFCNFTLECHNIVSDLLSENGRVQICVKWQTETYERSFGIARVHQRKDLVEFAAIAIACIMFPNVVHLSRLEATDVGDRADYWINDEEYMVEISGTERTIELRRRHREKTEQLLSNPYRKNGYVIVCDFSSKQILFSFHKQED